MDPVPIALDAVVPPATPAAAADDARFNARRNNARDGPRAPALSLCIPPTENVPHPAPPHAKLRSHPPIHLLQLPRVVALDDLYINPSRLPREPTCLSSSSSTCPHRVSMLPALSARYHNSDDDDDDKKGDGRRLSANPPHLLPYIASSARRDVQARIRLLLQRLQRQRSQCAT